MSSFNLCKTCGRLDNYEISYPRLSIVPAKFYLVAPLCEHFLYDLDLNTRVNNCLCEFNYSVQEILGIPEPELLRIKNLGRKNIFELKRNLYDHFIQCTYINKKP